MQRTGADVHRIIITGRNSTVPAFAFSGIPGPAPQPAQVAGGASQQRAMPEVGE